MFVSQDYRCVDEAICAQVCMFYRLNPKSSPEQNTFYKHKYMSLQQYQTVQQKVQCILLCSHIILIPSEDAFLVNLFFCSFMQPYVCTLSKTFLSSHFHITLGHIDL